MIGRILSILSVTVALALFMEFVAWWTHKYVMHGFLWVLHEDHHRPPKHRLQKNDLFTLFFASWAIVIFLIAWSENSWLLYSVASGITLYGLGYFLFHDVMFHRRLRWLRLRARTKYLQRIVRAHAVHHQTSGRIGGRAFGFLYASRAFEDSQPPAPRR